MRSNSWAELFVATKNVDKIREITDVLSDVNIHIYSINEYPDLPDVIENQTTLEGNALKKASEFSRACGTPALADDTGLEVDALNGAPGIYSSRYAGDNATYDQNVDKLIKELKNVPKEKRTARFRTVIALVGPGFTKTVEGVCEGMILTHRRGRGGFGYDPVFYIPETGQTFAQMPLSEKNKISHRGKALQNMKKVLMGLVGES